MLKATRIKNITEILEEDTVQKTAKILKRKPVTTLGILFSFIITVVIFGLTWFFYIYCTDNPKYKKETVKVVWECLVLILFFFGINTLLLTYLKVRDPTGTRNDFSSFVLKNNLNLFRITLTLFFFFFIISLTAWIKNITSKTPIVPVPSTVDKADMKTVNNDILNTDKEPEPEEAEKKKKEEKIILQNYLETRYESIIGALVILFGSILLKRMFLQFINYRIHFKYYKERIRKNTKIVKYLQSLNNVTGEEPEKDIEAFNEKIFLSMANGTPEKHPAGSKTNSEKSEKSTKSSKQSVKNSEDKKSSSDKDGDLKQSKDRTQTAFSDKTNTSQEIKNEGVTLNIKDFNRHFGNHDGKSIFALFDIDENGKVTKDEFCKRYTSLLKEKELLDTALNSNDSSINKLDIILSIVLYPLTFVFILFCLDAYSKFESAFKFLSAMLLSVSFAFSSVVSSTFQSIIFVFFVRPFDIGDVIEYDNKIFLVSDLGLLYSTFIFDSTYETIPNEVLRGKCIKNLRKSTHVTTNLKYSTSQNDFEKIEDLKDAVNDFLQDNSTRYHEKFRFYNISQTPQGEIKFEVQIIISCPYQEIQTFEDRKDKFAMFMLKTAKEKGIGLRQFEK